MTYLAVVKYALDASQEEKRRALLEGLEMIAMELVSDHDFTPDMVEDVLSGDVQGAAELEYDCRCRREEEG